MVITRDRKDDLVRALSELARLPERPPVVVVDNGSRDGTAADVAAAHSSVEVVALEGNAGASARNIGVRAAGTPYVAFSDDDSWWEPGALTRAVDVLDRHPSVGVVVARTLVGEARSDDPVNAELAASPLPPRRSLPGPRVLGFLACAAVVRSGAFLEAGGFAHGAMVGGEEELLACDLVQRGWDLVYVPEVVALHHPSTRRSPTAGRRRRLVNALWFAWLRRPAAAAVRRTLRLAPPAVRDRTGARALVEAFAALPRVLRSRRPVPPAVERQLRLLD